MFLPLYWLSSSSVSALSEYWVISQELQEPAKQMCSVSLVSFSLVQIQMYQSLISTVEKKDHLLTNQMHVPLQNRSYELLDTCTAEI